ncbi:MAG: hypothetical protein HC845_09855 [Akkermansiaceae bacterium]|nr:hypothetical protein [Akkermansiaceae bacterium]
MVKVWLSSDAKIQNSEVKAAPKSTQVQASTDRAANHFDANHAAAMQMDQMTAALRGYFSATNIDELIRHVRHPQRVRPLMEEYYKNRPLVANPMTNKPPNFDYVQNESLGNFWAGACELSDGKISSAYLEILSTGEPKVDWETMIHYQPMDWDEYSQKRPIGEPMDFRLYAENGYQYIDEFEDKTAWRCYRLTNKFSETVIYGYIKAGSPLEKELTQSIESRRSKKRSLILRLNVPIKIEAKQSVIIEKIVSKYWIMMDSPTP